MSRYVFISLILLVNITIIANLEYCDKSTSKCNSESSKYMYTPETKYILYDVNYQEGFNLQRDVYLRMAIFMKNLINDKTYSNYKLVLPPWSYLYHWRSANVNQNILPWSTFFDIKSLKTYAPVIEMSEFLKLDNTVNSETYIDELYALEHYQVMFENGEFVDKWQIEDCDRLNSKEIDFWRYTNISAVKMFCLLFQGFASQLKEVLQQSSASKIMFRNAEIVLHDTWGTAEYWKARRSMRFSKKLVEIATNFRKTHLNSINEKDGVIIPDDWRDERPGRRAVGGNYLCVHLRRRDFLYGRSKFVPSIEKAADQLNKIMDDIKTDTLFVATDATSEEYGQLKSLIKDSTKVFKFDPDYNLINKIKDGGVAIVDQIICSHARHFVGTYESTFSFRIQEQREILGFDKKTTFNRLCGDTEIEDCTETTQWTIVY